jgi:mxaJ protein
MMRGFTIAAVLVLLAALGVAAPAGPSAALRVCADPNNLPFTNNRLEGFENRIADLLARDSKAHVEYVWWAQRQGFLRNTLQARTCDVVMGLPTAMDAALTTRPYYRSTYVFVTQRRRHLPINRFDDERLRTLKIGIPLVGGDDGATPPAYALARQGLAEQIVGYSVYGDYRQESPPSSLIAAVGRGDVDVAVAWGPLAGYFAARQKEPLELLPATAPPGHPSVPVEFDMSMAVRRDDGARKAQLDDFIVRRRHEIDAILAGFHVPRTDLPRKEGR